MEKIQKLNNYIKKGTVVFYIVTTVMICVGLVIDLLNIHEISALVIYNNLITLIAIIISFLLYLIRVIKLPLSYGIIIYSMIFNTLVVFFFIPYGESQVLFFLRNSLFVAFLATLAGLLINRFHSILITVFYIIGYILLTYITKDEFLKETILNQVIIFLAYSLVIFFFVTGFEKSMFLQLEKTKIISKQNDKLKEINSLLNERQKQVELQSEELLAQKEELSMVNEELEGLVATKDKFFSIISHDLRNPLSSLMGFSELMLQNHREYNEEKRGVMLSAIYESSKNSYNLLDNLLTWSRMQTGGLKIKQERLNLLNLVTESTNVLENMRTSKKIELKLNIRKGVEVIADQFMLSSVIQNLVSNAIKFTPNGGTIQVVEEQAQDGYIQICISDTGIGIPKENIPKLFKIDQSYTIPGTNKEKGTGLGLLLCKEFIEKNNGKIWVESQPKKGSNFYITAKAV